jgi:putative ubiquitin-RnfH superfamily antitoxin RatB of RatAB toxin-antitoxin module
MIFKVKVKRDKQPKDDMRSFFCGDTAEVIINGKKYIAKGQSSSVMDGASVDDAIMDIVLGVVKAGSPKEWHSQFISFWKYPQGCKEMVELINRLWSLSEYEIDGDEVYAMYDKWWAENKDRIAEEERKWKEECKRRKAQGIDDSIKCDRIVIDTAPISSDFKVNFKDIKLKPFNILEVYKRRAKATKQLAEDEMFRKLLATAKKIQKKTKKKKRKKPECPHKMYKWKDTLCKFTDTLCKGEKYCSKYKEGK